jgi:chemotaxis protein methyltransferase CheR
MLTESARRHIEAGLLERALIYATDIDPTSLELARAGLYDASRADALVENYRSAGGLMSPADYYTAASSRIAISPLFKKHILFSDHSLATDAAFAEVHMVSCRNVFIYFDQELQNRALGLFRESLCPRGFLGLGAKETMAFSTHATAFESIAPHERIYRLR